MLWTHEADRLGIVFTEADVRRLLNRIPGKDVFGNKPFVSSALAKSLVAPNSRQNVRNDITAEDLLKTVTDEFRVIVAKRILGGDQDGIGRVGEPSAPPVTPYEFLQYYREQRTTRSVWMLPINVKEEFDAKARQLYPEAKIPDSDLRSLFDRYKDQEPTPERAEPAFKEPARVKVEWLRAGPDLPYFKEQANLAAELPAEFKKYRPKYGPHVEVVASIASQVALCATSAGSIGCPVPWLTLSGARPPSTAPSSSMPLMPKPSRSLCFRCLTANRIYCTTTVGNIPRNSPRSSARSRPGPAWRRECCPAFRLAFAVRPSSRK